MRAYLKEFGCNIQNEHPIQYNTIQYKDLDIFLEEGTAVLAKGPVVIILVEDDVEIATTLRHHQQAGFASIIAFTPDVF